MAKPVELKDSLQKITALGGLLRSDLLELSQTRDVMRRTPVLEHIHWIADQFEAMAMGLRYSSRPAEERHTEERHTSAPASAYQPDDSPSPQKEPDPASDGSPEAATAPSPLGGMPPGDATPR